MLTLIIGGSASGKSEYAEQHVLSLEKDGRQTPRIYIASMEPFGEEAKARIARHHRMRAQRGFSTIECYTGLGDVLLPPGSNVLLEDMGNLTANEMFSPAAAGYPVSLRERILGGIDRLLEQCAHLTIVTNEIFSDGTVYGEETMRYQKELAAVNREIAGRADLVVEVVCGLPNVLKGVLES